MSGSIGQTNLTPSEAPSRQATPPDTLNLRAATKEDANAIADIGARVFEATFKHTCSDADMKDYLNANFTTEVISSELQDDNKEFSVACLGSKVVAFACLTRATNEPCIDDIPEEQRIELQRVYADLDVHGKGVAREMMTDTLNRARQRGFKYVWLGVWESNFRARRFYERFGFKCVGSHDFWLGQDRQTDDIFLLTL